MRYSNSPYPATLMQFILRHLSPPHPSLRLPVSYPQDYADGIWNYSSMREVIVGKSVNNLARLLKELSNNLEGPGAHE